MMKISITIAMKQRRFRKIRWRLTCTKCLNALPYCPLRETLTLLLQGREGGNGEEFKGKETRGREARGKGPNFRLCIISGWDKDGKEGGKETIWRDERGKGGRGKEEGGRRKGGNAVTFHFAYITSHVRPRVPCHAFATL
jgi:hypothetical protein